eukprot:CAMPEP_0181319210 /NCGR_PEP_ID=MMETSP1101-20121128/17443_1 /TAXON_ID=46948 /ORGANISM="Rhodomonas abbreviata, Strain Caron Lab Isolate" /LENGTH=119 /DNA_ID=CAMNT_0023426781 /DNA_START=50 /DNA_END=409 /DNA_ORIENTATION=-
MKAFSAILATAALVCMCVYMMPASEPTMLLDYNLPAQINAMRMAQAPRLLQGPQEQVIPVVEIPGQGLFAVVPAETLSWPDPCKDACFNNWKTCKAHAASKVDKDHCNWLYHTDCLGKC